MNDTERNGAERRASERTSVLVPSSILHGDRCYTATLLNIVESGALLETSAPLGLRERFILRCGSLVVEGIVVWQTDRTVGARFADPITTTQVSEQARRTAGLLARQRCKTVGDFRSR